MSLMAIYRQKYGEKTAEPKGKKMPPELLAKFKAKGKKGVEKTAEEKIAGFKLGKVAGAAFMDELRQLNERDVKAVKKASLKNDPFVEILKKLD